MKNYLQQIKQAIPHCLTATHLPAKKIVGKVRDIYDLDDKLLLITTDRLSAFDRWIANIPFKGQVLNQISAWWFEKTKHIIANHMIAIPDPNALLAKKVTVFPVEIIVRGYITGTTNTSLWVNYKNGVRDYCGNPLNEGLQKNQQLSFPLVTPTTKSAEHDSLISPTEIVQQGLMTQQEWDVVSKVALELFECGSQHAAQQGLILVDTKYEFGKDAEGNILIVDEMHTPDSSRYWLAATYQQRMQENVEPENFDKELLRLWFKQHCDPYNEVELPQAPEELILTLSQRYIQLFEMITGATFQFPPAGEDIAERLLDNKQILEFNGS